MPTSQQKKVFTERLRQLEQLGFAMPFEHYLPGNQPTEVVVEQDASPFACPVFDMQGQGTLYLVWLSVARARPGVCLFDYRFVPPWKDEGIQVLLHNCGGGAYILPNDWSFPREDVLNVNFKRSGWRLPCTRVEGLLCGMSETPIPQEYGNGEQIRVGVEFFGKSGRRLAGAMTTLCIDRPIERGRSTQRAAERGEVRPPVPMEDAEQQPSAAAPRRSTLYD